MPERKDYLVTVERYSQEELRCTEGRSGHLRSYRYWTQAAAMKGFYRLIGKFVWEGWRSTERNQSMDDTSITFRDSYGTVAYINLYHLYPEEREG